MCLDCGCLQPSSDHGDPAHITIGDLARAAAASGVSIGQAAANLAATLNDIADEAITVDEGIAKGVEEQRYVLGIAYQAGRDDRITKGVDGGRDYFTPEELEKAAFSLLRNGPRTGLFHIDGTDLGEGAATIVESYIYRPDEPWVLADDLVVRKGDWLVGAILSPQAWDLYKQGKINGWSPQGTARRRRRVAKAAPVAATFTVTGPEDQLAAFAQWCSTVQWLCSAGASRDVQIAVDGDGSGALRFDFGDLDVPAVDEGQMDSDVVRIPGIGG